MLAVFDRLSKEINHEYPYVAYSKEYLCRCSLMYSIVMCFIPVVRWFILACTFIMLVAGTGLCGDK